MTATATLPALPAHEAERIPIGGDWLLWRDFAVRSAGFPVDGLAAFGAGRRVRPVVTRSPATRRSARR